MAIDLRKLSDKLDYPQPPRKKLWLILTIVLIAIIAVFLLFLFPAIFSGSSVWFWASIILLPSFVAGMVFGIRLFIYEQRYEYVKAWNEQHDKTELIMVATAQKYISFVDFIYQVSNICRGINTISINNQAIIASRKFNANSSPIRYTRIDAFLGNRVERLQQALQFLFEGVENELKNYNAQHSIELVLSINEEEEHQLDFKSLFLPYQGRLFSGYTIQQKQNGLFFLDDWLDSETEKYILYCDISLHSAPFNESAEFISLHLLNYSHEPISQLPIAIHRPVKWQAGSESLKYVMLTALEWGNIQAKDIEYVWFAGVLDKYRTEILILMNECDFTITVENTVNMDWIFGKSGNASDAIALSSAIEQTKVSHKPQLVIYQTQADDLQMLVIKSIDIAIKRE